MKRLTRQNEMGLVLPDNRPETLAAALESLTAAQIDEYKSNALKAARELCWEKESRKLAEIY